MEITFHGAAQTVTGSKHLLHLDDGYKILLDCGMFQGRGVDSDVLNRDFGFNPREVDCVILSHAHIDHSGLLPFLVKQGFRGKIFCTPATRDLCKILLLDSAYIQESDARYLNKKRKKQGKPEIEPLYNTEDAYMALSLIRTVKYRTPFELNQNARLTFTDAGHIIGSAAVHLDIIEQGRTLKLSFSGDVGRYGDLILKSPESFRQADYILVESTYGDELHQKPEPAEENLRRIIEETCVARQGKVIIPAFSVGRTQELLYHLNNLSLKGHLPAVPVYVDSPLSEKATLVVKSHPWNFNEKVQEVMKNDDDPFDFPELHFVEDAEESKLLNFRKEPCIIISASGMAEAGRIKHHIKNNIEDPKNTILLVGYSEPGSLAGRLKAGADIVSIFGEKFPVRAQVQSVQSMSAHGDQNDLIQFLSSQNITLVKKVFLVHGDLDTQLIFQKILQKKGYEVEIPQRHQSFELS